ncbi:MAG: TIGR00269 family protein, partial [Methanoregula sp.]|nr:TIGR00269 family protein [Methanoregula sp.]
PQRHLCASHLIADVEERAARTIRERELVRPHDRIAVAFSGGKDSTALLVCLSRLLASWDDVSLVAITVDEGIAGYRDDTIRAAERVTKKFGIEHVCVSFTDLVGDNLDTLLVGRETQACTVCGILRRKALSVAAHQAGATKIATGHNLDDEAQSVLMNTLRGDLPRLVRTSDAESLDCFIPRIKPLADISETEIAAYLFVQDLFFFLPECPYTRYALRLEVRSMLSALEQKHPGTMRNLIKSKRAIEKYVDRSGISEPLRRCRECGDPCSGELCQVCSLRQSLGK